MAKKKCKDNVVSSDTFHAKTMTEAVKQAKKHWAVKAGSGYKWSKAKDRLVKKGGGRGTRFATAEARPCK